MEIWVEIYVNLFSLGPQVTGCGQLWVSPFFRHGDEVVPQQVVLGELPACRFPFGCQVRVFNLFGIWYLGLGHLVIPCLLMPKSRNIPVLAMGENVPFWWLHHGCELMAGLEHPIWGLPTEFCLVPHFRKPPWTAGQWYIYKRFFIAAAGAISVDWRLWWRLGWVHRWFSNPSLSRESFEISVPSCWCLIELWTSSSIFQWFD